MRRLPLYLLCLSCAVLASCNRSDFKGFKKMDNGANMQFHEIHKEAMMPQIGDHVIIDYKQTLGDSLFYSSDWTGEFEELEITESVFVGDMMAGLLNMHADDSATVVFLVDSMCIKALDMDEVPSYLTPGTPIYTDVRVKEVIPAAEVEKRRAEELVAMRQNDVDRLGMYYSDESNEITETGLIILSVNGKGRGPKDGEVVKMNFNIITLDGDTILDLYGMDPVAVLCGDEELGAGFAEAVRYVPEGGDGHFLIPSSLAFDSIGLNDIIPPYTSLFLNAHNTSIMTMEEFEEEERLREKAEEAENQKRLAEEPARIAKFVKDFNVNVKPSETGVYYLEIQTGTGDMVDNGDLVSIHYNIYNLDNKLIESSYEHEPLQFVFGSGEMVPGIEEGVSQMRVGGKSTIIVPSKMGFGDVAIDKDLPAYSTVIFDLELVSVQKSR